MIPETIGRYEVKGELGRGGMAAVYRALDPRFRRDVAIKVLPEAYLHDPMFRARFDREAQTLASLEFAGIVPVYDYGEENGQPYLVMRYMPGGSLSDRIVNGPMSLGDTLRIMQRLAPALDQVHAHGIIHRDLKPANILFDQFETAFISDFGIARLAQASNTLTGDALIGTPAYMSPEQARGDPDIDGRSDIYALGAILFEMLAGQQPYSATTPMGVAMKHIIDPIPRILDVNSNLPADIQSVIDRALEKMRERRFAAAAELVAALEVVVSKQATVANHEHPDYAAPAGQPVSQTQDVASLPRVEQPAEPVFIAPSPKVESPPTPEQKPVIPAPPPVSPVSSPGLAGAQPVSLPVRSVVPGQAISYPSIQPQASVRPPSSPNIAAAHPYSAAYPIAQPRPVKRSRWPVIVGVILLLLAGVVCGVLSLGGGLLGLGAWLDADSATLPVVESPSVSLEATLPVLDETLISAAPLVDDEFFYDDFSDPASGWPGYEGDDGSMKYDHGSYRILVDAKNQLFWATPGLNLTDVSISVDATKVAGPDDNYFGVICRYQDDKNFYFFILSSQGYYGIGKMKNGEIVLIGMDTLAYSENVHAGKTTNIIQADCLGEDLSIDANGSELISVSDADFTHGDIGLIAGSEKDSFGVNILFDNYVAFPP